MATEEITLYDEEKDILFETYVNSYVARRAERDSVFAAEILQLALQQQSNAHEGESPSARYNLDEENAVNAINEPAKDTPVISEDGEGPVYRWSKESVLLPLESYRSMMERFNRGKVSHKKLWEEIAASMKWKGHEVTCPQCSSKLRSLRKTYKSTEDHNNKSGNNRRSWQFLDVMDEIFSSRSWNIPDSQASSTGIDIRRGASNVETDRASSRASYSSSKPTITSVLGKRLRQKEEHEKNREKRHKERMEMDKKLLEILQNLVN